MAIILQCLKVKEKKRENKKKKQPSSIRAKKKKKRKAGKKAGKKGKKKKKEKRMYWRGGRKKKITKRKKKEFLERIAWTTSTRESLWPGWILSSLLDSFHRYVRDPWQKQIKQFLFLWKHRGLLIYYDSIVKTLLCCWYIVPNFFFSQPLVCTILIVKRIRTLHWHFHQQSFFLIFTFF